MYNVSTILFDVTYLNTDNYVNYIAFPLTTTLKGKKGGKLPTNPLNFQAKKANKPLFFRPKFPHLVYALYHLQLPAMQTVDY